MTGERRGVWVLEGGGDENEEELFKTRFGVKINFDSIKFNRN